MKPLALIGQALGLFAVTNIDDIVILAVFFGRATTRAARLRVVAGQYLGFVAILALSVLGAFGATFLPQQAIPYLGVVPLLLGIRAAWGTWRDRKKDRDQHGTTRDGSATDLSAKRNAAVLSVAAVTFANGGDNIGVYVPVFATMGIARLAINVAVFLVLVGAWCAAGWFFASRPIMTRALSRWGHYMLPVVLIAIGLVIMIEGRVFGL